MLGKERAKGWAGLSAWLLALCLQPWVASGQSDEAIPVVRFQVERFEVVGPNPVPADETNRILAQYLGEQAGVEGLLAAADELESAVQEQAGSFYRVILPPQELDAGVVRLEVVVFAVADVNVVGNEHYSEENVRRSLPDLKEGEAPVTRKLTRNLGLVNAQPGKQVAVTFKESETVPNALDAQVEVDDVKPWTLFTTLANTGTNETGQWRWGVGGQNTNLFDLDHVGTINYTTAPGHPSDVKQFAISYYMPIYPWSSGLTGYYVYSDVDSGTLLGSFDVTGRGEFWGLRYTYHLPRHGRLSHRAIVGLDDKQFDNTVLAGGINTAQDVRSRPLLFQYAGDYAGPGWQGDYQLEFAINTRTGGGNNDFAYQANRAMAKANWKLFRWRSQASALLFKNFTGRVVFNGQYANQELIPGEQFGLGGIYSVRGFREREVTGDDGARMTAELWTPELFTPNLRALAFVDWGIALRKTGLPTEKLTETLLSVGPGLRWQYLENLSVQLDAGYVIDGVSTPTSSRDDQWRGHLSVLLRY